MKKIEIIFILNFILFISLINAQNTNEIASGNNQFAINLFKELKNENQNKNIFFSPFSISTALAMTYAGARNETEKQMSKTLNFSLDQTKFHINYKLLNKKIKNNAQDNITLNIANSIWAQENYKFLASFFNEVTTNYNAKVKNADFINDIEREKAIKEINRWVDSTTLHKISEVLNSKSVNRDTRMVLVNAIYFYGKWATEFKKENTKSGSFNLNKKNTINTEFMNRTDSMFYYEDSNLKALEIPYKEKKASMIVILPNETDGIENIENSFNYDSYKKIIASMNKTKVRLLLPKFKTECDYYLKDALSTMGMPIAFSYTADFSGMTGNNELYINNVFHKAMINVSEEGTEASAVTAVFMFIKVNNEIIKNFIVDHPFLFIIKENETGTILFIGKIINPKE